MFKFMIIFNQPSNHADFENAYNDLLALVERMPDIQRRQVVTVLGSPLGQSPLFRILEVYYDSQDALEESLKSPAGQEAGAELRRFQPGSFDLVFAEVYEEAGGQTIATDEDEA
jgi:uncharacterized protein (TIGR02118 family)